MILCEKDSLHLFKKFNVRKFLSEYILILKNKGISKS